MVERGDGRAGFAKCAVVEELAHEMDVGGNRAALPAQARAVHGEVESRFDPCEVAVDFGERFFAAINSSKHSPEHFTCAVTRIAFPLPSFTARLLKSAVTISTHACFSEPCVKSKSITPAFGAGTAFGAVATCSRLHAASSEMKIASHRLQIEREVICKTVMERNAEVSHAFVRIG